MKKISLLFTTAIILLLASCSSMIEDFKKHDDPEKKPAEEYTVIEKFEALLSDNYDPDETKIQLLTINPVNYIPQIPEGFELFKKEYSDESKILIIEYKRKRIELIFNANGGSWDYSEENKTQKITGKYGAVVPLIDITNLYKPGEKFIGWSLKSDSPEAEDCCPIPETFPSENHEYFAVWDTNLSNYYVYIWEENIEDNEYTNVSMNVYSGIPGKMTNYEAVDREGFDRQSYSQVRIKPVNEPSAILNIYYKRKIITYTFTLGAEHATWTFTELSGYTDSHADRTFTGKYGEDFAYSDYIKCYRDERSILNENGEAGEYYNFEGWKEIDALIPDPASEIDIIGGKIDYKFNKDRFYKAVWDVGCPEYKVKHLFEQPDGTYEEKPDFPEETYSAGIKTITEAKAYTTIPGYYPEDFEQQIVKVDNTTVVEIYYKRVSVTVLFSANGGEFTDSTQNKEISGTYLDPIPHTEIPSAPVKEHFKFLGWYTKDVKLSENPVFPVTNVTYEAKWERTGAVYYVEYWYENLDNDEYSKNSESSPFVADFNEENPIVVEVIPAASSKKVGFSLINAKDENDNLLSIDSEGKVKLTSGINPDDSTVVKFYYKRNRHNVSFDPNGLVWNKGGEWNGQDNEFGVNVLTRTLNNLKYGTKISAGKDDLHSTDTHSEFIEWEPAFNGIVTDAETQSYKAKVGNLGVEYTVKYLFETIDSTGDNLIYESLEGYPDEYGKLKVGERTRIVPSADEFKKGGRFEGFELTGEDYNIIMEENPENNIVEIKFNRKLIQIDFNATRDNGTYAKWYAPNSNYNEFNRNISGKYGAPVTLPDDLNDLVWNDELRIAYFDGWETADNTPVNMEELATFPSESMNYYAIWTEVDTGIVGGAAIDSSLLDISLTENKLTKNEYEITVTLPFNRDSDKWKIYWAQGKGEFIEGGKTETFQISYMKNTITVKAVYADHKIPFSKTIILNVE